MAWDAAQAHLYFKTATGGILRLVNMILTGGGRLGVGIILALLLMVEELFPKYHYGAGSVRRFELYLLDSTDWRKLLQDSTIFFKQLVLLV